MEPSTTEQDRTGAERRDLMNIRRGLCRLRVVRNDASLVRSYQKALQCLHTDIDTVRVQEYLRSFVVLMDERHTNGAFGRYKTACNRLDSAVALMLALRNAA